MLNHTNPRAHKDTTMAKRPCPKPGCPTLIEPGQRYCPKHQAEANANRGTTTQRGYGTIHQRLRTQLATRITQGHITCPRCGQPITPNQPWDLGHDDHDRTKYNGPEHSHCNRSAGGRSAHPR